MISKKIKIAIKKYNEFSYAIKKKVKNNRKGC